MTISTWLFGFWCGTLFMGATAFVGIIAGDWSERQWRKRHSVARKP